MIEVINRREELDWRRPLTPMATVDGVILHHPAHPSWGVNEIHNFHRNTRKWNGFGYDYFVYTDGTVVEVRGEYVGAHAGSPWNETHISICVQGYLHEDSTDLATDMTDAQVKSVARLVFKLMKEYGFELDNVKGHGDVGNTACPGNLFREDEVIDKVAKLLKEDKEKEEAVIYRVQIGAFGKYENADRLAGKAEAKDYETYIGMRDSLFIVQIGAFSKKESAENWAEKAQADGFDAYISTQPLSPAEIPEEEEEKPEEKEEKEEKPDKDIPKGKTKIKGEAKITEAQATAYVRKHNPEFEHIVDLYWQIAPEYNIRPEVALAQAIWETGHFNFGGDVEKWQKNPCGLGAVGTPADGSESLNGASSDHVWFEEGVHGAIFKNWETGVKAHVQHLYAYASEKDLPDNTTLYSPRFNLVIRGSAPRVEWLGAEENPEGIGWATDPQYGLKIIEQILTPMMETEAPEDPIPDEPPKDDKKEDDKKENGGKEDDTGYSPTEGLLMKIIKLIRRWIETWRKKS